MDKQKSYVAFMTLFWTGMSLGEMLAFTPADIDFKTISISKSHKRMDKRDVITPPNIPKGNRVITVPNFLLADFKDYMNSIYCLKKMTDFSGYKISYGSRNAKRYQKQRRKAHQNP